MAETTRDISIEPLGDRILVRPCKFDYGEESPIIRPEITEDAPETGVIVDTGQADTQVEPGDHVIFGKYAGYPIRDRQFVLLVPKDVLCRVDGVVEKRGEEMPRPRDRKVVSLE